VTGPKYNSAREKIARAKELKLLDTKLMSVCLFFDSKPPAAANSKLSATASVKPISSFSASEYCMMFIFHRVVRRCW
jgi:hypothetical protein